MKIKVIGDECIWERISLMNAGWVIQWMLYQVSNAVSDQVCLKKTFNVEIFYLKKRLKKLCYYSWKSGYKLLSISGLKIFFTCFYDPPFILYLLCNKTV